MNDEYNSELKDNFNRAYKGLEQALIEQETELIIDACLYRFKVAYELAWKTIKDYLEYNGIIENTGSPRQVIQAAFKQGLIENGEEWIDMMLSRNNLSHLYDKKISREIYDLIKNKYVYLLKEILQKI